MPERLLPDPSGPSAVGPPDPDTPGEQLFWFGARRSGLERLARSWQDDARNYTLAEEYGHALVVVGRFDQALDVTVQAARTAPDGWLLRHAALISVACHPVPGHAANQIRRDRVLRRRLTSPQLAMIEALTAAVVSEAALTVWWRFVRAIPIRSVSGSLWAAASLAALRADDAHRAVAAERRASFADPAAPLLAAARQSLGLPSASIDPCFESDIRTLAVADLAGIEDAASRAAAVSAARTADPDNPVLLYESLSYLHHGRDADTSALVDALRDLLARPALLSWIRTNTLNLLAWVLAVDAASANRRPHSDGLACADLLIASPVPANTPWIYRDTAALIHATSGDLTAEDLLSGDHLGSEPEDTQASVALTRAHIAYLRGDLPASLEFLKAAWPRMQSQPHAQSLSKQLEFGSG